MLVDCADWSVARVGQRTRCQDSVGRSSSGKTDALDVDKVNAGASGLLLILLLIVLSSAKHEAVVVSTLWLFRVPVGYSCHLLVEDAVVDIGLFGVEVFVE